MIFFNKLYNIDCIFSENGSLCLKLYDKYFEMVKIVRFQPTFHIFLSECTALEYNNIF